MNFDIMTLKDGKPFCISYIHDEYCWHYNGKRIVLPKYNPNYPVFIAVGTNYICVIGVEENASFIPYDLKVYNFTGDYLWNVGDIARSISPRMDAFVSIVMHTKETLTKPPWAVLFGSCTLDDSHEYLTAYDGGEEWLFDITDRKCLKRVFTK